MYMRIGVLLLLGWGGFADRGIGWMKRNEMTPNITAPTSGLAGRRAGGRWATVRATLTLAVTTGVSFGLFRGIRNFTRNLASSIYFVIMASHGSASERNGLGWSRAFKRFKAGWE